MLDKEKTSPYQIYQYLYNSDDEKVFEYLKVLTFLPREKIEEIESLHKDSPEKRIAQKALAFEVVKDIHGAEEAEKAVSGALAAFSGEGSKENMPTFESSRAELDAGKGAIDLFFEAGLGATKSDVRRQILQNGAAVNGKTFSDVKRVLSASDLDGDGELVLRAGKKKFVRVVFK